jgi:hypothetical protein
MVKREEEFRRWKFFSGLHKLENGVFLLSWIKRRNKTWGWGCVDLDV